MRRFLLTSSILMTVSVPALAENWVQVHKTLYIETESLFRDSDGYIRFKTRELDDKGAIRYQHKEAEHCEKSRHYFRKMYNATAVVNNRNDSDVNEDATWTKWRQNPQELYDAERIAAIKNFVCSRYAAAKNPASSSTPAKSAAPAKSPTSIVQPKK